MVLILVRRILGQRDLSVDKRGHHFEGTVLRFRATGASRERRGERVEDVRHLRAEVSDLVRPVAGESD